MALEVEPMIVPASVQTGMREGWRTVRFGDVVCSVDVSERNPLESGLERYVGLEHLEPDHVPRGALEEACQRLLDHGVTRLTGVAEIGNAIPDEQKAAVRRDDAGAFAKSLQQLRGAGMQVAFTSVLGPWLGKAADAPFTAVADRQVLAEVYAWR